MLKSTHNPCSSQIEAFLHLMIHKSKNRVDKVGVCSLAFPHCSPNTGMTNYTKWYGICHILFPMSSYDSEPIINALSKPLCNEQYNGMFWTGLSSCLPWILKNHLTKHIIKAFSEDIYIYYKTVESSLSGWTLSVKHKNFVSTQTSAIRCISGQHDWPSTLLDIFPWHSSIWPIYSATLRRWPGGTPSWWQFCSST